MSSSEPNNVSNIFDVLANKCFITFVVYSAALAALYLALVTGWLALLNATLEFWKKE